MVAELVLTPGINTEVTDTVSEIQFITLCSSLYPDLIADCSKPSTDNQMLRKVAADGMQTVDECVNTLA